MKIIRDIKKNHQIPTALTIGNFDGVHLGHQSMIHQVLLAGTRLDLMPSLMLFEPQPREFFHQKSSPARLTTLREKLEILKETKIETVYVVRFDQTFSKMTAEYFLESILVKSLCLRWLLVGDDFRFGANRAGGFSLLENTSRRLGFAVEAMESINYSGQRISSTAVRQSLKNGKLDTAEKLLGRQYSMSGKVRYGDALGRTIGFPTANIKVNRVRVPFTGIFAVRLLLDRRVLWGVASLGVRPTVKHDGEPILEVNIFDFNEDIYGKFLKVEFLIKIRDEKKFKTLDMMVLQMRDDKMKAKRIIAEYRVGV